MVIQIDNKPVYQWNSWDFVKFFLSHFRNTYMNQTYPLSYAKDGMIMKRIISKFRQHNRSKETVAHFIMWVFKEYQLREDFTEPLTIGFLPSWINEYLQIKPESEKKKKKSPPQLSNQMQTWIKQQKDKYKPDYGRRRLSRD